MKLTEDEVYRTSTQYRLWSFTPKALAELRANTNKVAAERVRAAFKRHQARKATAENGGGTQDGAAPAVQSSKEPECLNLDEEQKIVNYYCDACLKHADRIGFPLEVKATAVQYIKRFYLTNSPMTYQPKDIMRSALFLAAKAENFHTTVVDFAERMGAKTTPEAVLAPEYLIIQALRFTLDVRHPHRGLSGGHMELLALARGKGALLPGTGRTAADAQADMLRLRGPAAPAYTPHELEARVGQATGRARDTLKRAALLTDAYFHHPPAQIWLAAYLLADEALTLFYVRTKFPCPPGASLLADVDADTAVLPAAGGSSPLPLAKVLAAIRACAALLAAYAPLDLAPGSASKAELVAIEKKLYQCRDPDKVDLVRLNKAQKRDALQGGAGGDGGGNGGGDAGDAEGGGGALTASVAKKRRLERERHEREADEFWGPELKRKG